MGGRSRSSQPSRQLNCASLVPRAEVACCCYAATGIVFVTHNSQPVREMSAVRVSSSISPPSTIHASQLPAETLGRKSLSLLPFASILVEYLLGLDVLRSSYKLQFYRNRCWSTRSVSRYVGGRFPTTSGSCYPGLSATSLRPSLTTSFTCSTFSSGSEQPSGMQPCLLHPQNSNVIIFSVGQ